MRYVADGLFLVVEMLNHRLRKCQKAFRVFAENLHTLVRLQNLDQAAKGHRSENVARSLARSGLTGFDDFVAGHALRPRQRRVHAQRAAQQDDEEDADESAHQQN